MRKCRHTKQELPSIKNSDFYQKAGFADCNAMAAYGLMKAKALRERARAKKGKADRADHRERKQELKSRQDHVNDVQVLINRIVVLEDAPKGCLSCDRGNPVTECGHYFHRGTKYRVSPLTLLRANLNGQCHQCNSKEGGRPHDYMVGFIDRYGQKAFDELAEFRLSVDRKEIPPVTIEECKALVIEYKHKLKKMKMGVAV